MKQKLGLIALIIALAIFDVFVIARLLSYDPCPCEMAKNHECEP